MGVPKFYRWISERYPCLSQVVKDYQIPEFDNFYLDMNGIIHACSHPNDDDPTFRISEDKIFNDIFRYIEALFRIIKPQKVMFLAVDRVAPRAKMNQQRGRRFRSAREAQDLVRKALLKGEVLPSEPRFDSNCIMPGTDFMARLHEHLKYFVNKKLSSDPTWQKVEIILSGHDSCTPEVCKQALKKHKYEIDAAKEEIRVHMLMEMQVAHITAEDCRRALSHCQQKMDRAAAWLLEQSDDMERRRH